jgi:uncharacterized protein (TIGR03435 family)
MVREIVCLAVCASGAACGQPGTRPSFEVASIKPSNADPSSSGIHTRHGKLNANNVTLKRCIMGAYGIGPHQIFGGPDWLDSDRFEIAAKADQPTDDDAVLMGMLQSLLADRFKLAIHRETRTISAFLLVAAKKGPKLERAEGGEASTNASTTNIRALIDARNTTMDRFAEVLSRQMDLPVVNRTGLEGVFNLKLQWTLENAKPIKPASGTTTEGPSIFTAIQEQLGLRLLSQKAPVEVVVVEHAERPSEN